MGTERQPCLAFQHTVVDLLRRVDGDARAALVLDVDARSVSP
jgi:hypothetical protein